MTTVASASPSASTEAPSLETRVADRKRALIAEIIEYKKSSRADSAEAIERLKAQLSELSRLVKDGVVDGWANVGSRARVKLDAWLGK